MKSQVIYATMTKHSAKLARAIGEALQTKADNIKDNPPLGEVDLLFIVGGIYGGGSSPELIEYVKKLDKSKIKQVAFVTSSVSKKQGQEALKEIVKDKGIPVVDEIICQGSFLFFKVGHPNKNDIKEAVDFALEVRSKTQA